MLLVLFLNRFSNIFVMNKIDEVIENCMNGKVTGNLSGEFI